MAYHPTAYDDAKFPGKVTLHKSDDGELSKTLEDTLTWNMRTTIPIGPHKTVS